MKKHSWVGRRNFLKVSGLLTGVGALQVLFNNCSGGFEVDPGLTGTGALDSSGGPVPPGSGPLPGSPQLLPPAPPAVAPPPGVLPSWVPKAGEIKVLSTANGILTNRFADVVAPYYEPFYSIKVVNDYSTHIYNPYWGTWGSLVGFGGGHAGTNDNTVWTLELGAEKCTFKRLTNPAPLFGTGTDSQTKFRNSGYDPGFRPTVDPIYGEYVIAGHNAIEPASPHSYGALDVIGPAQGGSPSGTLVTVVIAAPGTGGFTTSDNPKTEVFAAHQVDFPATTGQPGQYFWTRTTTATGSRGPGGPMWTDLVPKQNRIYIETRASTATQNPYWFDLTTKTYVAGTGTPRSNNGDTSDTGVMFHVPERDLLIHADRFAGRVRLQYMKVGVADTNPSWVTAVNLSAPIAATQAWQCACWCPDNGRLILGAIQGDPNCIYEVEIPADLSQTWTAVRVPFPANQTIDWPGGTGGNDIQAGTPTYKKWSYSSRLRSIVFMPFARLASSGPEIVYVYRPRST